MEELARLSLHHPVRVFVDNNTDTADNLQQEFVRIRPAREADREAIVAGTNNSQLHLLSGIVWQTNTWSHEMDDLEQLCA